MVSDLIKNLLNRNKVSNKYSYGHVLVIGGSPGMVGAPFLAAMGALRSGAGLVTIASTPNVIDKLEKRVVEIMTLGIDIEKPSAVKSILDFIKSRRVSVVVIGPGMDRDFSNFAKDIIPTLEIPVVIDAGALSIFNDNLNALDEVTNKNKDVILTPHEGEFNRLSVEIFPAELNERKKCVVDFAQIHKVTLVCKGNKTLVGHLDGSIYENSTGNAGLATAGTGDVLAGVIAGLIAQGLKINEASDLGVQLHSTAGDLAVKEKTQPGMIASDLFEFLPSALALLGSK